MALAERNLESSSEHQPKKEHRIITPEGLWSDNHSLAAYEGLARWEELHDTGRLITIKRCSDARVMVPKGAFYVSAIAAGGIQGLYLPLVEQSQGALVVAHYDGSTAIPGVRPRGCGGQDEKAKMSEEERRSIGSDDVAGYVREFVTHEDPIVNALYTAGQLSDLTEKTVLAGAQDHLTGETNIIAVFNRERGKHSIQLALPWAQMIRANTPEGYDPRVLYEAGVPKLDMGDLPEFYAQIMEQQQTQMKAYNAMYGDLSVWNKVQNPSAVVITEDARPKSITYPAHFGGPNSVFSVRMPRMHTPNLGVQVNDWAINLAIRQAEYALGNAVANADQPDKGFNSLRTLILETRHPEIGNAALEHLKRRPLIHDFLRLPNSQIITSIVDQGVVEDIQQQNF